MLPRAPVRAKNAAFLVESDAVILMDFTKQSIGVKVTFILL